MADVEFDHFEGDGAYSDHGYGRGRMSRMVNLAGAACSVALILGLGVWGYKLAVRDVNGIPVIRALAGPMRMAPDNPGGEVTMHQGLSVNAVAAAGTALPIPETLMLAPRPVELTEEDTAGIESLEEVSGEATAEDMASLTLDAAALPQTATTPLEGGEQDAVAMALAEALGTDVPLADADLSETTDVATMSLVDADGAMAASPRPKLRPTAGEVTDVVSVAAVAPLEVDPATIAAGTKLVQLGAFDDEAAARAEWARLGSRYGELMSGKSMVLQAAQSGGRTFYRLRALGFGAEDEARRFCTALLAEQNATCIPVAQR